jgi:hypothetical protein
MQTPKEIADSLPRRVSQTTVIRWINVGIKTDDGRLKLKATRQGGRLLVTPGDLQEFLTALNGKELEAQSVLPTHRSTRHVNDVGE